MVAVSALLHGLLILALVWFSWAAHSQPRPLREVVTRVTLVGPAPGPLVAEKLQRGPVREAEQALPEPRAISEIPREHAEPDRKLVRPKAAASPPVDRIPLVKRKRPPQRVEVTKKVEEKPTPPKTEVKPAKKKEDPQELLEQRLAALRRQVASRKADAASRTGGGEYDGVAASGRQGARGANDMIDPELARWFEGVKGRINAHWSLPADGNPSDHVAIVGVQIAENGRLVHAAIDASSGDELFDKSALRAVFQAAPFPSMSLEIKEKIRQAGGLSLRFTPRGMQ